MKRKSRITDPRGEARRVITVRVPEVTYRTLKLVTGQTDRTNAEVIVEAIALLAAATSRRTGGAP
jgi:hypothetical protein